jgi:3-dehydroquinate synthase
VDDRTRVPVTVPGGGYDVVVGRGTLDETGDLLRMRTGAVRAALVTDDLVSPLFGDRVEESLARGAFAVERFVVPHGERSKSWERAGRLVESLAAAGLGRDSLVVALGCGVVGDLAGFAAAVFLRGVPVVHVPTTLLAQVDSSIGGKTGVDLERGKNLAGAFWQPVLVVTDPTCLATLPPSEWRSGLAEVAKSAMLAGEDAFGALETGAGALAVREHDAVDAAVLMAAGLKARFVSGDERESGEREALNLGHTYAHALERVLGYGTVTHGSAVAGGLRFAARIAETAGVGSKAWTRRQEALLDELGLAPVRAACDPKAMLEAMRSDKKVRGGRIRFVLSSGPGEWGVQPVDEGTLIRELDRTCG